MKINFVGVQNFRKLKKCRIPFGDKETLFVGANNSGKTSAIDVLINFLDTEKQKRFSVTDFTLSNWSELNKYAVTWGSDDLEDVRGSELHEWQLLCPSIDVWLDVKVSEVQKVAHLIPTLKWNGEPLGVRLTYQPKDIDKLRECFLQDYEAANKLTETDNQLSLWPRDLKDYLDRELKTHFEIKAFLLDPAQIDSFQVLDDKSLPLEAYPFNGIFNVDTIEAQRGFTDPNGENGKAGGSLSAQLSEYYNRHLNPTDLPDEDDIEALSAINAAQDLFDDRLERSFKSALGEIKKLGYPGFSDPDIKLSSKVNPIESLEHDAAVVFDVQQQGFGNSEFSLPEKYNGLGYKNLIHIVFKLIAYRDKWQRVGKAQRRRTEDDIAIEPIHLVLIEEPEAHLHAQVQQVFIRKAYDVLRKGVDDNFTTQMLVSSHSSYIAHEAGFDKLCYFRRKQATKIGEAPCAEVVDLSKVFGKTKKKLPVDEVENTNKFVSRYLKTTHCDLFFSNGIILVEGAAERMLIPHFISHKYPESLNQSYISILEIGGAHAQKLRPLIEVLGLPTLVVTDTDAVFNGEKIWPQRDKGYEFGSDTLKEWFGLSGKKLDEIIDLPDDDKIKGNVRAAYQCGIQVDYNDDKDFKEAIPYTFEDAIALTNLNLFKTLTTSTGMVKKMHLATLEVSLDTCSKKLYLALAGEKAKMALDLLYDVDPDDLDIPEYIKQGLDWLESELDSFNRDFIDGALNLPKEKEEEDE
ncbi:MAG: ATP-dependent endonuclease [Moritella sp.]|nr:MAG: ATP-dependent endonuclease [Moritella sp.]